MDDVASVERLSLLRPIGEVATSIYLPVFASVTNAVGRISLTANGRSVPLGIEASNGDARIYGVVDLGNVGLPAGGGTVDVVVSGAMPAFRARVQVPPAVAAEAARIFAGRGRRAEFVRRHLACVVCGRDLDGSTCRHCGASFAPARAVSAVPVGGYVIPEAINTSFGIFDSQEQAVLVEAERSGEMVLNFGAGIPSHHSSNMINLEIADMPCTDVVSVSDRLPFRDGTFGAVVCLHVLKHVRHPWLIAKEFQRVLKPGGVAVVTVPYICEVHGFPYHYFNPTPQGLRVLFDGMDVVAHEMKGDAHPINSVQQVLSAYLGNLPEPARTAFSRLTIGELLSMPLPQAVAAPWATELSEAGRWSIPAHTTISVRKRPT